jgi:hypothetical protein
VNKSAIAKSIIEKGKASRWYHEGSAIYVSAADTARLIRATLAERFPGTKFWVRSDNFSMGSSVDVYFDATAPGAPSKDAVRAVVDAFGGAGFDGMIDMKYDTEAWLTMSGSVTFAGTRGTEGSRGTVPAVATPAPAVGAVKVDFGSWLMVNDSKPYGAA